MKRAIKLLLVIGVLAGLWLAYALLLPAGPTSQKLVQLKTGSTPRGIARELEQAGIVRNRWAFLLLHYLQRRTLKAGEYSFDHRAPATHIYDRIARGDVYFHPVVIPEGYNIFDIAQTLETSKLCSKEEFLRVAQGETALIADLAPQARTLEGYLFPDTYNFVRTQSPRDIAAEMVRRFRREAQSLGFIGRPDMHRLVTMASIVEKETSVDAERGLVAGVFENRLHRRIGLATDPSVIYAALLANRYDGVINQSDLAADSPYNTYRHAGLPPGPIANPGRESLLAALNPTKTNFIYFVANNKGGHNFARSLTEHNRNVVDYRRRIAK